MNESLKLENQLCFPLYACAKEIVRRYTPLLEPLGLTYTQYIAMMVMWEHKSISVRDMGKLLFLDSGTLTPMFKKMEKAGWITRKRSERDERYLAAGLIWGIPGVIISIKGINAYRIQPSENIWWLLLLSAIRFISKWHISYRHTYGRSQR